MRMLACLMLATALQAATAVATTSDDWFVCRDGLANARKVFEQTGKGRVVFLGGSITRMNAWCLEVQADLQKRFPNCQFTFVNAGIPSTGSTPAAFRLERDVLAGGRVDLLFEEAAVNDHVNFRTESERKRAMEGIVRHARSANPNMDIVFLYFADPYKMKDYRAGKEPDVIVHHDTIAAHYGLPAINLAKEVTDRIDRGEFTWEKDFKNLHPAPFGHKLYGASISRLFDACWAMPDDGTAPKPHVMPEKLDAFAYSQGRLLAPATASDRQGFVVVDAWKPNDKVSTRPGFVDVPMLVGSSPGESFSLSFRGTAIGLLMAAGPDTGIIEFRIDGGTWQPKDCYTPWSGGLHMPWLHMLNAELPVGEHQLDFRITDKKNAKSKGTACRIVAFAVNAHGN